SFEREKNHISHPDFRCKEEEGMQIADTNHIILGCTLLRGRQRVLMHDISTCISQMGIPGDIGLTPWFNVTASKYEVLRPEEESDEEEDQIEIDQEMDEPPKKALLVCKVKGGPIKRHDRLR